MYKIFLITYDPNFENEVLKDRIKSFDSYYNFFVNNWLIKTGEDVTAKDIYNRISVGEFEQTSLLVLEISSEYLSYWGRMNTKLWEWLDKMV